MTGSAAALLAGCSYLESMFPDKERDYQYTTEIQMINLPPELRRNKPTEDSSGLQYGNTNLSTSGKDSGSTQVSQDISAPPTSSDDGSTSSSAEPGSSSGQDVGSTEITSADESDERDDVTSVDVVKYDDGETRLRLGAKHSRAWRVINKSLSRNTIEVTERNHEQSHIKIQYDPNEVKMKDEGFMDEINFILHGIGVNSREYVLKLEEHGDLTDVMVLNDEFLPMLNDNDAMRLLKRLADTIKTNLAKKAKAAKEAESSQ